MSYARSPYCVFSMTVGIRIWFVGLCWFMVLIGSYELRILANYECERRTVCVIRFSFVMRRGVLQELEYLFVPCDPPIVGDELLAVNPRTHGGEAPIGRTDITPMRVGVAVCGGAIDGGHDILFARLKPLAPRDLAEHEREDNAALRIFAPFLCEILRGLLDVREVVVEGSSHTLHGRL